MVGTHRLSGPAHRRREIPIWVARLAVGLSTGFSLGLGFFDLNKRSLWLDEGYTWLIADQRLSTIHTIANAQGYHLYAYYLLIHAMIAVFGDSAVVLRSPSVVAGALCIPLIHLVIARLAGRTAGVYAAILLAVSEPFVFWQQNARDYAFVSLFAVLSMLALVISVQSDKWPPWALWLIVTTFGSYTHPEMLLLLPPEMVVAFLWARSNRTRVVMITAVAIGAIAAAPILAEASHSSVYQTSTLQQANYGSATEISTFLASAAASSMPVGPVDHALLGLTFGLLLVGAVMLATDLVDFGCRPENFGLGLTLACSILPFVLAWAASESGHPDFLDRYLVVSLWAVAGGLAIVLSRVHPPVLGIFGLLYLTVFRMGVLIPTYHVSVQDYRDATMNVIGRAQHGDCVTFSSNNGRILWDYYAPRMARQSARQKTAPVQVMPSIVGSSPAVDLAAAGITVNVITATQSVKAVAVAAYYCNRVFLVGSQYGSPTGSPALRAQYASTVNLLHNMSRYFDRSNLTRFGAVEITLFTPKPGVPHVPQK